jgi:hypothetical protein
MDRKKLQRIIDIIKEDMALHQGQIAGTVEAGDDPPVKPRKKKKYIYLKGVRKNWKPDNGRAS